MRKFLFSVLLVLSFTTLFSKTIVNIDMPGSRGLYARAQAYDDFINYQFKTLDSTFADAYGKFTLDLDINKTTMVFIQVRFIKFKVLIEPNKTYNIKTETIDFKNPEYYPKEVVGYLSPKIEFVGADKNDINNLIKEFDLKYSEFIDSSYIYLIRGQGKHERIAAFMDVIHDFRSKTSNMYFSEMLDFEVFKLNLLSRELNKEYLVKNVFNEENIKIDNHNYMDFFNEYWNNYLINTRAFPQSKLIDAVNNKKSYNYVFSLVQQDSLMKDTLLSELAILISLPAMYASRDFNKAAIIDILTDISSNGRVPQTKKAARNMIQKLNKFQLGSLAPDFRLFGLDGETYSKENFKDKYLYLIVLTSQCKVCYEQMKMLNELNAEYDDIMNFVVVDIDAELNTIRQIKNKYEYNYKFLFYNFEFLDDYEIDIIPQAFLIDKEGNFINKNAPLPTDGFNKYFSGLFKFKER